MIAVFLFVQAMALERVAFPHAIAIIFLIAYLFTEGNALTINSLNKRIFFLFLILVYISTVFYNAYATAPYYEERNFIPCKFAQAYCKKIELSLLDSFSDKLIVRYLQQNLKENETFITDAGTPYYYLDQYMTSLHWANIVTFQQQVGRRPSKLELKQYANFPENYKYYITVINGVDPSISAVYDPVETIRIHGKDVIYVYDMDKPRTSNN